MLNDSPRREAAYGEQVPAVHRAALVLALLATSAEPQTLTALSRSLRIAPSTLLAILTTLRREGLVSRTEAGGLYSPGPGLAALGAAAAQRLGAIQLFRLVADRLVAEAGESALLWLREGQAFILAAGREGPRALRYVPPLGRARLAEGSALAALATGSVDLIEEELEAGVRMLAAVLPTRRPAEVAVLAVAGPNERLAGEAGDGARRALLAAVAAASDLQGLTSVPADAWDQPQRIAPDELDAFLQQGLVATLAYLSGDGYPATVPLWYAWDGEAFWLAPHPGAEWAEHVRRNPRVSLAISESAPPLRRVLVRGRVEAVHPPTDVAWRSIEAQLNAHYAAIDASRWLPRQRQVLRLTPERLIAWRGLLRHPGGSPTPEARKTRDTA